MANGVNSNGGSMGLRGKAAAIANLSVVGFLCVLVWYVMTQLSPGIVEAHREEQRITRQHFSDESKENREALKDNTKAIYGLQQEIRAWKRNGYK